MLKQRLRAAICSGIPLNKNADFLYDPQKIGVCTKQIEPFTKFDLRSQLKRITSDNRKVNNSYQLIVNFTAYCCFSNESMIDIDKFLESGGSKQFEAVIEYLHKDILGPTQNAILKIVHELMSETCNEQVLEKLRTIIEILES